MRRSARATRRPTPQGAPSASAGAVESNHQSTPGPCWTQPIASMPHSLMAAAQAGRAAVVKLLLAKRAEPTMANGKGQRALELARAGKHQEVLDLLLPLSVRP